MAQGHVQLPADSTGKNLGTDTWTNAEPVTVHGQSMVLYGPDGNVLSTTAAAPAGSEKGLIVRPVLTDVVAGPTTITATDAVVGAPAGAGATVSGASTAGSLVSLQSPGGDSDWVAQVTGLTTGNLYFEASLDSTTGTDGTWIALNGRQTGIINTVLANNASVNGVYRGNIGGFKYFRVRSVGALTGTPSVTIRFSDGIGAVFLNAGIPPGSDSIGAVQLADPTTKTQMAAVSAAGRVSVDGSGVSQPITAPLSQSIDGTGAAQPFLFAYANVTTAQTGVSLVAAPAAGRSIRVISYALMAGATMNVSLIGAATTILFPVLANAGVSFPGTLHGPAFQCAAATALTYTTSTAGQFTIHLCYVIV